MLIILFGLSGSGKNFVGNILQNHFDFHFWDADQALPQDMLDCIAQKQSFTQAQRDNFTRVIIEKVSSLENNPNNQNLVVAQALYKEKNRKEIQDAFPDAIFFHVKASPEKIMARRRNSNEGIDADYAKKISLNFENPILTHEDIENNSDKQAIVEQLSSYLNKRKLNLKN